MADIMLPLFLPGDVRIDRVTRAMGGITLFSAAYVAENVRGGLQAIPTGQIEAAHALGLSARPDATCYIVLPQALRSVIPANVGLFISLLKDTTLVIDHRPARAARHRPRRPRPAGVARRALEVYVFVGGRLLRPLLRDVPGELPARARAGRRHAMMERDA